MLYLNGNNRYKYKTEIQNYNGQWVLGDSEWTEFVNDNVPLNTTAIHFIRQCVDDYYVTVYEADGSECPGYDRRTVQRLVRCLIEYVPGRMIRMNSFSGAGWDEFVETAGIQNGQKIVFTNIGNYTVSVVMIGGDGLGLSREDIRPTMLRMPGRKICECNIFAAGQIMKTIAMKTWCSTLLCVHMSVITSDWYEMKVEMVFHKKKPTKTNHVRLTGYWWGFGYECGFVEPKMLRIKLIRIDPEIVDGIQIQVPIFHVC
ncbi:hypothetical protein Tco_0369258 [Tanacetum coccineum]